MRLISGVIHTTYGTIIYALVLFLFMNRHLFESCYHRIYICVLTAILVLFTIECLRTVIFAIISMFVIYMKE